MKCSLTCKKFCVKDRQTVMNLKSVFTNESVEEVRDLLQNLNNGCEHGTTASAVMLTWKKALINHHISIIVKN